MGRLGVERLSVRNGSREWQVFASLRGPRHSTRDLGEDESLAVALTQAERGVFLPFVTYDRIAARQSADRGVVTLDFLDTLAWLVACGVIEPDRADEIEASAVAIDGWKRPVGYVGEIQSVRSARQNSVVARVEAWWVSK